MQRMRISDCDNILIESKEYLEQSLSLNSSDIVLIIHPRLFYPYKYNEMTCDVSFKTKNEDNQYQKLSSIKIHRPYHNKKLFLATKQIGKSYCDFGIPIIFNTYEELSLIEKISICWNVKGEFDGGGLDQTCLMINYNVFFEKPQDANSNVYVIKSNDKCLNVSCTDDEKEKEILIKYSEEFQEVLLVECNEQKTTGNYLRSATEFTDDKFDENTLKLQLSFGMDELYKSTVLEGEDVMFFILQEANETISPVKRTECFDIMHSLKHEKWCRENRIKKEVITESEHNNLSLLIKESTPMGVSGKVMSFQNKNTILEQKSNSESEDN